MVSSQPTQQHLFHTSHLMAVVTWNHYLWDVSTVPSPFHLWHYWAFPLRRRKNILCSCPKKERGSQSITASVRGLLHSNRDALSCLYDTVNFHLPPPTTTPHLECGACGTELFCLPISVSSTLVTAEHHAGSLFLCSLFMVKELWLDTILR